MQPCPAGIPEILSQLEAYYGKQEQSWPRDPYCFLVWWNCGYPPSDRACAKGWESLRAGIGVEPGQVLAATVQELVRVLRPGGLIPELRAMRLREIAARVKDEFGGDLGAALAGPTARARKLLKTFPTIADPGVDRILLFSGLAAVAAVPSNCPQVLVRIQRGQESAEYSATYRHAQQAIEAEIPETVEARSRAYLLLKKHGQELCKRSKPRCERCPVHASCRFPAQVRT